MPRHVKAFVLVVIAAGAAVVLGCLVAIAGRPLEEAGFVALLAAGILLAELYPVRLPGIGAETSFSASFSFALLVTHGTSVAVPVTVAGLLAADAIRRRAPVKVLYNGAQYAISWLVTGLVYGAFAGPPAGLEAAGPSQFLALLPAAAVFAVVNTILAMLPVVLLRGESLWRQLSEEARFVAFTTLVLVAFAPIVVAVAARDLLLVPLLGLPLAAIQLGSRQALLVEAQARVDTLTGIASRHAVEHALERRLADPADAPAVVVLDLTGFADVNDALGHRAGDALLCAVAERLTRAAGHEELVARTGGDTFAVVCDDDRAEAVVAAAVAALDRPVAIAGLEIDVRAVAGIAAAPADGAGTLLRQADVALRAAKARRVGWVRFEPAMSAGAAERLALAPELRRAIPAGELVLHYQPKLDVRTGLPAGVEALVRWDRPGHGLVPPDVFIGLAERTGLIRPLTTWVLERAVADQARWAAAGHRIAVAVNLSTRAILPGVVDDVAALLARGAGELELEITESAAMHDLEGSLAVLGSLAALGVRLSVDDFGTGHSSLAYLERLPVAALKIDRGFVAGLELGTANRSIVDTTIELAHRLGLEVVAEGVEDDATLAVLRALGCDLAQGFGIARPMPADAVPAWTAGRAAGPAVSMPS